MDMTPQEYQEYVKRLAPKSPIFKDTAFAFFIGGAICALGQLIQNGFLSLGLAKADAGTATSICLIFRAARFTIVFGAKTREACPFMVYARLFC